MNWSKAEWISLCVESKCDVAAIDTMQTSISSSAPFNLRLYFCIICSRSGSVNNTFIDDDGVTSGLGIASMASSGEFAVNERFVGTCSFRDL